MKREKANKLTLKRPADTKVAAYQPTTFEAEALMSFRAAAAKRAPGLKVTDEGSDKARLELDDPDEEMGTMALMKAVGTTDLAVQTRRAPSALGGRHTKRADLVLDDPGECLGLSTAPGCVRRTCAGF